MSEPFTREDMVDTIATAISDSLDADWNSRTGAEAVVHNCGVFDLYEALDQLLHALHPASQRIAAQKAREALAKVRGEQ